MVGKENQDMETGVRWLRDQMKDKKFRLLILVALAAEIALAAEFTFFSYGILKSIRYLLLTGVLFLIAWIDQHEKKIPNRLLLFLLGGRAFLLLLEWVLFPGMGLSLLISSALGMLLGGGLFLLAHFISRGGVGMGDVKLFGVIGCYAGAGVIMPLVFLTVMVSAVYSIVMLLLKKIKLKEEIPFAPFVLIGTILTLAMGM